MAFQTLTGFRDFLPADCAQRNYIFTRWREVAMRHGFVEYEGPTLESTDLYRKKSGQEITEQLFCFTTKGGEDVAMRPETTPTLARMAAARQRDFAKPMKWFQIGTCYRYERKQRGRKRVSSRRRMAGLQAWSCCQFVSGRRGGGSASRTPVNVCRKATRSSRSCSLSCSGEIWSERLGRSMPPFS